MKNVIFSLVLAVFATGALAQQGGEAPGNATSPRGSNIESLMREFGLIGGPWSADCARPESPTNWYGFFEVRDGRVTQVYSSSKQENCYEILKRPGCPARTASGARALHQSGQQRPADPGMGRARRAAAHLLQYFGTTRGFGNGRQDCERRRNPLGLALPVKKNGHSLSARFLAHQSPRPLVKKPC